MLQIKDQNIIKNKIKDLHYNLAYFISSIIYMS
jgi:hypothetical protein